MNQPDHDPSRQERLDEALVDYMERVDRGEAVDRAAFLAAYPDLRGELSAHFDACDKVNRLAGTDDRNPEAETLCLRRTPSRTCHTFPCDFGPYELLEELGRGGMGVIYRATQRGLDRMVALKMILAGPLADPVDVQRFRNEAEAVARLDHPNIVPIYDVGEHDGRHYFAMKLVEGGTLSRLMASGQWPVVAKEDQQRTARMMVQIARAVQHAHKRGILHRDLKPANILLANRARSSVTDQSAPEAPGPDGPSTEPVAQAARVLIPLVSDFGLARRLQAGHELTATDHTVGTPSYMAPEQVSGRRDLLTTATDVWGLGAILYALLASRPPFQGESAVDILRQVQEKDPAPPRSVNAAVDRDLEIICLKCLEKEPGKRYGSAEEFALDLERWLGGEPIQARPAGTGERLAKWVRRRPALTALLAVSGIAIVAVVALIVGMGYTSELSGINAELRKARNLADDERKKAEGALKGEADQRTVAQRAAETTDRFLYLHRVALAESEWRHGNIEGARDLLMRCQPNHHRWEWHYLDRVVRVSALTLDGHKAALKDLAYSPDGRHVATCSGESFAVIWDADTGQPARKLPHGDSILAVAFSPDGRILATGGTDKMIRLWDVESGEPKRRLQGALGYVNSLAFTPDGKQLVSSGADRQVRFWDLGEGKEVRRVPVPIPGLIHKLLVTPGGDAVLAGVDRCLCVWDMQTGQHLRNIRALDLVMDLAVSADGKTVATGGLDPKIELWDWTSGVRVKVLTVDTRGVSSLAFSPDGTTLAVAGADPSIKLLEVASGHALQALPREHGGGRRLLAFSPRGDRLASSQSATTARVWDLEAGRQYVNLKGHEAAAVGIDFAPSGDLLASAGREGTVRLWSLRDGKALKTLTGHTKPVFSVAVRRDAPGLASVGLDWEIRLWTADGRLTRTVGDPGQGARVLAFSPTAALLAVGGTDGRVRLWEPDTGKLVRTFTAAQSAVTKLAFSPDGRWLAGNEEPGHSVRVWDVTTGETVALLQGHGAPLTALTFTRGGAQLACACQDRTLWLWDVAAGKQAFPPVGLRYTAVSLACHPDGERLAMGDTEGKTILWDTITGAQVLTLRGPLRNTVESLSFSPDGRTLAAGTWKGEIHLWESVRTPAGKQP